MKRFATWTAILAAAAIVAAAFVLAPTDNPVEASDCPRVTRTHVVGPQGELCALTIVHHCDGTQTRRVDCPDGTSGPARQQRPDDPIVDDSDPISSGMVIDDPVPF